MRFDNSTGRREYLKSIGAVTTIGLVSTSTAVAKSNNKVVPEPYEKRGAQSSSPKSDVYLKHVSELSSVRGQLSAYERTQNPRQLFTFDLQEKLSKRSDSTFNITVSTAGEQTTITTNGKLERTIHGWRPKSEEVDRLAAFGEPTFVPKIASTKVGLANVAVDDLPKIAALDFVLEIGHDPEIQVRTDDTEDETTTKSTTPTADDLKTSSHLDFDSASYSLTSLTQIGIVDTGYTGNTSWNKKWAKKVMDTDSAKDFTDENDWEIGKDHGTDVADTAAYMLKDGDTHDNLIVPLKVLREDSFDVKTSAIRNAIEYALTNDIPVLNISVETKDNASYCTSTVCEELDSYASAGYVATCATGNDSKETEVCHPATSWFTVGVGGYNGSCSGGYQRDNGSNYGEIQYYDNNLGGAYCSWCYDAVGWGEFQPNIYGCYYFLTDSGNELRYTSMAAPQVAAAAAIQYAVHGSIDYSEKVSTYNNMNDKTICPSEATQLGRVLHVPDII